MAGIPEYQYQALIATGGIGSGVFFELDGNHTLGREESRSGRYLDRRDYCKLHIVSHYVARLLGPGCRVIPVGRVGGDRVGEDLRAEMAEVGIDLRHVTRTPGSATMHAVCLVYPDGSGGNLTTGDSACARVDPAFILRAEPEFAHFAGRAIAAALPEVPLAARRALLTLGTRYGCLRVASFNSAELHDLRRAGSELDDWLAEIDLLALNLDEAGALAGISPEGSAPARVVEAAIRALRRVEHRLVTTVTCGADGSWCWDGIRLQHRKALPVSRVMPPGVPAFTAGAGDAHLAGSIVGLMVGLTAEAGHELAVLMAAMSVTSPHTINKAINGRSLLDFARQLGTEPSPALAAFLAGDAGDRRECTADRRECTAGH